MKVTTVLIASLISISTVVNAQVKERFKENKASETGEEVNPGDGKEEESDNRPSSPVPDGEEKLWDRFVFGGNLSLTFGTYTSVYLAPSVGYKVTDNFIAGTGFIYSYLNVKYQYNGRTESYENQLYGPKVFLTYFPTDFLYVGSQFEYIYHNVPVFDNTGYVVDFTQDWTPVLFLEGGYTQPLGRKGYIQLGIKYNVLHDVNSPYGSSWFPVIGFFF